MRKKVQDEEERLAAVAHHPLQSQPWFPNGLRGLSSESDGRGCVGRAPGERCGGGSGGGGSGGGGAPCSQLSRGRERLVELSLTEGLVGREGGRLRRTAGTAGRAIR